jgi:hypothetical protein
MKISTFIVGAVSSYIKLILAAFSIAVVVIIAGCGGGGGSGGSSAGWYYHWNCNGDPQCLATNPGATNQASGTSGPISGGQSSCIQLMTFASSPALGGWSIPPATQSCDNSPSGGGSGGGGTSVPTITNFSPTSGSPGTAITITGTNFGSSSTVTINGVSAYVFSTSGTQIVVYAPQTFNYYSGPFVVTTPGGTVTSSTSFSSLIDLNAVTWSGTKFVAVGNGILTSPNGITWTPQTNPVNSNGLRGVTWSGTKFVSVGNSIISSTDGITWTLQRNDYLYGVTWSGSQFVSVGGFNGTVLTSPDGVTWTPQTGATNTLTSIIWSGTQYVAAGGAGLIVSSPNGVTWTSQTSGTTNALFGVAWSGSQFVAVGTSGTVLTSPNGITWTLRATP